MSDKSGTPTESCLFVISLALICIFFGLVSSCQTQQGIKNDTKRIANALEGIERKMK